MAENGAKPEKKKSFFGFGRKKKSPAKAKAGAAEGGKEGAEGGAEEDVMTVANVGIAEEPKEGQPTGDGGANLYRHLESLAKMGISTTSPGAGGNALDSGKLSAPKKKIEEAKSAQSQKVRSKRLMKELKDIQKSAALKDGVFSVDLVGDNLFEWDVKLRKFDEESKLAHDLTHMARTYGVADIWLRLSFPSNYPFDPPFVRVLAPLVQGGYVLTGGAICMELLTPDGWSQAYTVEAVIMQTMATMIKGDARIVAKVRREFSEGEARRAYDYLVKTHAKHGWNTPPKAEG